MRFLLIASFPDSLFKFRGALIFAIQASGLEVHVAAPDLPVGNLVRKELEEKGVVVHDVRIQRTGTNVVADLFTTWHLWRLMRCVKPEYVLSYSIKPVIYGSIAAWLAGVPRRFALVTGLGYSFQVEGRLLALQMLVQLLYKFSLRLVDEVFFQNPDDRLLFLQRDLLKPSTRTCVVNGSGVDIINFGVVPLPFGPPCFLMCSRLLGNKGVREFAQAARRIRLVHSQVRCLLVGWIDINPDAISKHELDVWISDGTFEFFGHLDDVRPAIALSCVCVLPSYREGTPRSVLEAMAMGRAVITTDVPGCRETVMHGDNGLLVPVKSVDALEQAMLKFVEDESLSVRMGKRSRQIAEEKYDVHKVNAAMLKEMGIV